MEVGDGGAWLESAWEEERPRPSLVGGRQRVKNARSYGRVFGWQGRRAQTIAAFSFR